MYLQFQLSARLMSYLFHYIEQLKCAPHTQDTVSVTFQCTIINLQIVSELVSYLFKNKKRTLE